MNKDTTTPKPSQPEQPSPEGLDGATCSPYVSDTPETDAHWEAIKGSAYWQNNPTLVKMEKLERELNTAIAALSAIEERYIDGCDTYEDWKFMGETARSFFEENETNPAAGSTLKENE